MNNDFASLLDPAEREHAVSVMREWVEMGDSDRAAAMTIESLIAGPLDWWIESQQGNHNTAIEAAAALCMHARDMAHRFKERMPVYQERVSELDRKWAEFQIAIGYGAIVRQERDAEKHRRWRKSGGEGKKGRIGEFRKAVIRLVAALRSNDPETILAEMRADCDDESETLDDLRGARTDPLVIRFIEVPDSAADNRQLISFVNVRTGNEESRSIKVLRNYLAPGMLPKSG